MRRPTSSPPALPRRLGFTLLELLITISIIGILIALLVPAVQAVLRNAREAAVLAEINQMGTGINAFKAAYGVEPPSSIQLREEGGSWTAESRAIIRRIWPRFDFALDRDFNHDGTAGDDAVIINLTGAECLVFFLGGVYDASAYDTDDDVKKLAVPIGFSKNPKNPFAAMTAGEVREGPFFEFKPDRLVYSPNATNGDPIGTATGHGYKVYIDSLPGQTAPYTPYVYASSYDGRGYDPADLVVGGSVDSLDDVYYSTNDTPAVPYKAQSFQIISAGYDHLYGTGGYFNPKEAATSLADGRSTTTGNLNYGGKAEFDNLTNFHNGRLRP